MEQKQYICNQTTAENHPGCSFAHTTLPFTRWVCQEQLSRSTHCSLEPHLVTSASAHHGLLCQPGIPGVPKPTRTAVLNTHTFWASGSFPTDVHSVTPHLCKWPELSQRYLGTDLTCPWTGLWVWWSGRGTWVAPGRCRAPTPAGALPAGLALNPARLVLADQKEFFLLCTIYLGKTRWLALESPFQVRSRPRSQRRCAVKEKPPFVQKFSAPPPTPTHLHVSTVCVWGRLAPAEDTSVPLIPRAQAQHQHCTENLPIPGHCMQQSWTSIEGAAMLTTLPPPERD